MGYFRNWKALLQQNLLFYAIFVKTKTHSPTKKVSECVYLRIRNNLPAVATTPLFGPLRRHLIRLALFSSRGYDRCLSACFGWAWRGGNDGNLSVSAPDFIAVLLQYAPPGICLRSRLFYVLLLHIVLNRGFFHVLPSH